MTTAYPELVPSPDEELIYAGETSDEGAGRSQWREAVRTLRHSPLAIIGTTLIAFFLIVAIFAPLIAPYDPGANTWLDQVTPGNYPGPSAEHWLGIDQDGRDVFSRLVWGARQSLVIGVVSLFIGATFGITLGLSRRLRRLGRQPCACASWTSCCRSPACCSPSALVALLGQGLTSVMIAIAVVNVPIFARLLRGQMLAPAPRRLRAGRPQRGVASARIVFRHVLPNSLTAVIVQGTLTLATAIIDAAGLAFLGLSAAPTRRSRSGAGCSPTRRARCPRADARDLPGHRHRHRRARVHPGGRADARGPRPEVPPMTDGES